MEVIERVAKLVKCPPHKVDLTHPETMIVIEALKGSVMLAVIPDYDAFNKFNFRSLTAPPPEEETTTTTTTTDTSTSSVAETTDTSTSSVAETTDTNNQATE
jgi:hypothetical protein